MEAAGVDFLSSLPCDRVKGLIALASARIRGVPLTREEEGVGISAGAALAGRRPAMVVQSSGVGNMINALMSLTAFYELPLAVFVSRRGVHAEGIAAQVPMGRVLPGLIESLGLGYTNVEDVSAFGEVEAALRKTYAEGRVHFFLMSPALWECSGAAYEPPADIEPCDAARLEPLSPRTKPRLRRYGFLEAAAPYLKGKAVVCNLGVPSKELYQIMHQESNFYMLGSMGMATPIGLGMAMNTKMEVVVIDGDGSLLMNPGTLATAAGASPENLTIIAIDNGSYGSTGGQPSYTSACVDLEAVARGFGIRHTVKVSSAGELSDALGSPPGGLYFIHALAVPGNEKVPDIPLGHLEIKAGVQKFLRRGGG
jgi:sulfopyruvate decarboxylase beta subunit